MSETGWRCAVVGATGAVGRAMIASLHAVRIPVAGLRGFASERSTGTRLEVPEAFGGSIVVEALEAGAFSGLDLVLLSAGAETSRRWVPRIAEAGAWAIDNSSAFRMDPDAALVVPEVNAHALPSSRGIVANPNCSTIQLVVALAPLRDRFGLARVHAATYQSVSGQGNRGIAALEAEERGSPPSAAAFPHPIHRNVVPQCDIILEDGSTREETKMVRETRRILEMPDLPVHTTCARVPVAAGHAEAVHVELARPATREMIRSCLASAPGIRVIDDPAHAGYPTPRGMEGRRDVAVGRIRVDPDDPRQAMLWIVADNLLKGAAWNAVQIARLLYEREHPGADLPPPTGI